MSDPKIVSTVIAEPKTLEQKPAMPVRYYRSQKAKEQKLKRYPEAIIAPNEKP